MATEKRLIDANATLELLRSLGNRDYRRDKGTIMDAMKMISYPEYTPTVDAVEVVRCKDCKYWNNKGFGAGCGWCEAWDGGRLHDNYCNYGERRTNG